jgi:hypothetical protein
LRSERELDTARALAGSALFSPPEEEEDCVFPDTEMLSSCS